MSKNDFTQVTDEFIQHNTEYAKRKKLSKKSGPYSKNDKDKRRDEVYRLHFEYGYSARKIADLMNVNRNTINEDIKYWYLQLALEINSETVVSGMLKQIHNMELQKTRLREQLDDTSEFSQRLAIEKFLFEIDSRLAQNFAKIMANEKDLLKPSVIEIPEDDIKKLVREMVLENESPNDEAEVYSEYEIMFAVIQKTGCNARYAQDFLEKIMSFGLELCKQERTTDKLGYYSDFSQTYSLGRFGLMRKYISADEFGKIIKKRIKLQEEIKKLEAEE